MLHDTWVRLNQRDTPSDIVIVGIDPQSLQDFGRWPWSRSLQADLFSKLAEAKPAGVAVDLLYTEPADNVDDDIRLAQAIQALPDTVLPVLTESRTASGSGDVERLPIAALLRSVRHLGLIRMPIDDDGIVRRAFLKGGYNSPHWPTLSLAALQAFSPESDVLAEGALPGVRSPIQSEAGRWLQDYEVMIPFYGPRNAFTTVSAGDVMAGKLDASVFAGKVVFVGMTSTSVGLQDVVPTPVSALDLPIPGVELHANLFSALRDNSLITRVSNRWNLVVALGLLPLLMWVYSRAGPDWSLVAAMGVAFSPVVISYVMYNVFQVWYAPFTASVPILVSYLAWSGNRLRFVSRFLANQSKKLDLDYAPRDRYTDEDLTRFFNHATLHLPIDGWRFSTRSLSHIGGNTPPETQSGLTEAWVRRGDVYARRFPTDDRLDVMFRAKDPLVAGEITRYIDRLSRVRRRIKPTIWHGSVEQLQSTAMKLGDQLEWLRAVKSFSDSILDGSPAGFVVWNIVGEPIRMNDLVLDLLPSVGKRPLMREFVERAGLDLGDDDVRTHFEDLMQRGIPWQFTAKNDEKELLIGLSAVGASLAERLICATVIDVSEIRTAERARAEMMDYLSHDLRSPLVSSLYLLDADDDDIDAEALAGARRNIQASLTMMDNLLHMSRADTVSVESFKEVLLDNVIDNVTSRYFPQAKARNIDLHVDISDDEFWLFGDAGLLDRAIGNLLSNAVKYSNEGGSVWLAVKAEPRQPITGDTVLGDKAGNTSDSSCAQDAVITVRDDGVGIDPKIIDSLFTRFKRDPSVADRFRGIGLGLALVARVARQHGGSVSAHSSGKGATFVFRLPIGLNENVDA